jgi:hypothetical protein
MYFVAGTLSSVYSNFFSFLKHIMPKTEQFQGLISGSLNFDYFAPSFVLGLASHHHRDRCPAASTLGGRGEDSIPGPAARPHRLPSPHPSPLPPTRHGALITSSLSVPKREKFVIY